MNILESPLLNIQESDTQPSILQSKAHLLKTTDGQYKIKEQEKYSVKNFGFATKQSEPREFFHQQQTSNQFTIEQEERDDIGSQNSVKVDVCKNGNDSSEHIGDYGTSTVKQMYKSIQNARPIDTQSRKSIAEQAEGIQSEIAVNNYRAKIQERIGSNN